MGFKISEKDKEIMAQGYMDMGEISKEYSEAGKDFSLLELEKYEDEIKNYDISEEYIKAFNS